MIPVRQARDEHALEVGHDRVERFALFRRAGGQRGRDVTGPRAGQDGVAFDVLEVIGDPLDELVAVAPEIYCLHVRAS